MTAKKLDIDRINQLVLTMSVAQSPRHQCCENCQRVVPQSELQPREYGFPTITKLVCRKCSRKAR